MGGVRQQAKRCRIPEDAMAVSRSVTKGVQTEPEGERVKPEDVTRGPYTLLPGTMHALCDVDETRSAAKGWSEKGCKRRKERRKDGIGVREKAHEERGAGGFDCG